MQEKKIFPYAPGVSYIWEL